MLTEQNKRDRLTGIGASEIPAIVYPDQYGGPVKVWESKVYPQLQPESTPDQERGEELEPAILRWTARRLGIEVIHNTEIVRHPEHPFVIATPDGFEIGKPRGRTLLVPVHSDSVRVQASGIVEVKAPRFGSDWTDPKEDPVGFPRRYFVQVQWQLLACRLDRAILSALVRGELWPYEIHADRNFQDALLEAAAVFWGYVERRECPPPEGPCDSAVWGRLVDQTKRDLVVPASVDEAADLARQYRALKDAEDSYKAEAEEAKARLLPLIGEHRGLDLGKNNPAVTYVQSKDGQDTDWQKVAREAGASDELIKRHTTTRRGVRRFLVRLPKED